MSQRSQTSLVAFNGGEVGPLLHTRTDLTKYQSACRQMENMIALPYGAPRARRGFKFIAEVKNSLHGTRLVGVNLSSSVRYVLEFGDQYIRFYTNGGQVISGSLPYELATPYSHTDVFELQFLQINDIIYIVHPDYAPRKLSRTTSTTWSLAEVVFDEPPFLAENLTATTITSSGTTGTVTLTASTAIFEPDHVGSYWKIGHRRDGNSVEVNITGNGNSSTLKVLGGVDFWTYGIWDATLSVQRTYNGSTWETVAKFIGDEDRNIQQSWDEDRRATYRINIANHSSPSLSGATTPRAVLEATAAVLYGYVKITAVGSGGTTATATVISEIESTTATTLWSEGAWSPLRGFPRTVALYQDRVWYGGTFHQPSTVWASQTGDFENFSVGSDDTDSMVFTVGSNESNEIQWLAATRQLCIGTSGNEWTLGGGNDIEPVTPTRVTLRRQSSMGSPYLQAIAVNDTLLFTQRGNRKLREFAFTIERDGYQAPDLTRLAYHITGTKLRQIAYQGQGDSIVWGVTQNGTLIGLTYERAEEVVAWHRHTTDGLFQSVATIYGAGTNDDEVWCIASRVIGGSVKQYVERMEPAEPTAVANVRRLDSFLTYSGAATTTFSGLSHLEGKTVGILADGADGGTAVVTAGAVTIPSAASVVCIGLPFTAILEPMLIDFDPVQGATSQGRTKRITDIIIRYLDTVGLEYSTDGTKWYTLPFRTPQMAMDAAIPLQTSTRDAKVEARFTREARLLIRQTLPLPLTVQSLIVQCELTGN